MLIIDMHLDLAMNAINWRRNLEQSVYDIRKHEKDAGLKEPGRGRGTVAFPEMRKGEVAVSSATVIARIARPNNPLDGYPTQEIAYAVAQGQLAYYRVLESQGKVRIVKDWETLTAHIREWENRNCGKPENNDPPLGFIISMEGADPIVSPEQVESWRDDGLRIVSLSHYGVSTYAHGTGTAGGLTDRGPALLRALDTAGMILDLTHTVDRSFFEALEYFNGPVLASHNNCRALCPGDRQFSNEQIKTLIDRGGVIGAALDAWMIVPNWKKSVTENIVCSLEDYVNHIDHICQLAGDTRHAAIGTDLDGGYGQEQTPHDLQTIADLQMIPDLLRRHGYSEEDVQGIMHGNWLRLFMEAWGRDSKDAEQTNHRSRDL
ncbi:MAG: membrane dipeptidase [Candidatus Latescibacteria bacterium]|nr:membrane dipeptidase [Candidatus Latescibacterota bacterium]